MLTGVQEGCLAVWLALQVRSCAVEAAALHVATTNPMHNVKWSMSVGH